MPKATKPKSFIKMQAKTMLHDTVGTHRAKELYCGQPMPGYAKQFEQALNIPTRDVSLFINEDKGAKTDSYATLRASPSGHIPTTPMGQLAFSVMLETICHTLEKSPLTNTTENKPVFAAVHRKLAAMREGGLQKIAGDVPKAEREAYVASQAAAYETATKNTIAYYESDERTRREQFADIHAKDPLASALIEQFDNVHFDTFLKELTTRRAAPPPALPDKK